MASKRKKKLAKQAAKLAVNKVERESLEYLTSKNTQADALINPVEVTMNAIVDTLPYVTEKLPASADNASSQEDTASQTAESGANVGKNLETEMDNLSILDTKQVIIADNALLSHDEPAESKAEPADTVQNEQNEENGTFADNAIATESNKSDVSDITPADNPEIESDMPSEPKPLTEAETEAFLQDMGLRIKKTPVNLLTPGELPKRVQTFPAKVSAILSGEKEGNAGKAKRGGEPLKQVCPLCAAENETVLYQNGKLRVIDVNDPDYPGYTRVIWKAHCPELTDLTPKERDYLMRVVAAVEGVVRRLHRPDKINLAQLGNQVPHMHWHVIPRWKNDPTFPDSIWATPKRAATAENGLPLERPMPSSLERKAALRDAIEAVEPIEGIELASSESPAS